MDGHGFRVWSLTRSRGQGSTMLGLVETATCHCIRIQFIFRVNVGGKVQLARLWTKQWNSGKRMWPDLHGTTCLDVSLDLPQFQTV